MDLEVLKRKTNTFLGEGGRVKIKDDSLLLEILSEWERWTGAADGFYEAIGISANGMVSIIGRAKKLRRDGFPIDLQKYLLVRSPQICGLLTTHYLQKLSQF